MVPRRARSKASSHGLAGVLLPSASLEPRPGKEDTPQVSQGLEAQAGVQNQVVAGSRTEAQGSDKAGTGLLTSLTPGTLSSSGAALSQRMSPSPQAPPKSHPPPGLQGAVRLGWPGHGDPALSRVIPAHTLPACSLPGTMGYEVLSGPVCIPCQSDQPEQPAGGNHILSFFHPGVTCLARGSLGQASYPRDILKGEGAILWE